MPVPPGLRRRRRRAIQDAQSQPPQPTQPDDGASTALETTVMSAAQASPLNPAGEYYDQVLAALFSSAPSLETNLRQSGILAAETLQRQYVDRMYTVGSSGDLRVPLQYNSPPLPQGRAPRPNPYGFDSLLSAPMGATQPLGYWRDGSLPTRPLGCGVTARCNHLRQEFKIVASGVEPSFCRCCAGAFKQGDYAFCCRTCNNAMCYRCYNQCTSPCERARTRDLDDVVEEEE
jgi:hypothetical protein